MTTYRLELLVTDYGTPFYPSVGTIETLSPDNAGYDLKVITDVNPTTITTIVGLGVKARMVRLTRITPMDTSLLREEPSHFTLEPRSSIYKTGFIMANGRGIIDSSYRGELKAPLVTISSLPTKVEKGTRLFQVLAPDLGYIQEVHYVASLDQTLRGEGGFGSTGTK